MASCNFALPKTERCERPSAPSFKQSTLQPGRFAQGPEEKLAQLGLVVGLFMAIVLI